MTVVQPELSLVLDEDAATRVAIADDLGDTMFVEAGAGSGKTKSLVDAWSRSSSTRRVPMREIAAVTFTEKAAAELRDRIRRELEQVATGSPFGLAADGRERPLRRARRARRRRGVHAARLRAAAPQREPDRGRPPAPHRGARRDRVAGGVRGALDAFVDRLLDDPALERALLLLVRRRRAASPRCARARARCNANWDLVAGADADPSPTRHRSSCSAPLLAELDACARWRARVHSTPTTSSLDGLVATGRLRATATRARARRVRASSGCSPTARRSSRDGQGRKGQLAVDLRRRERPRRGGRGPRAAAKRRGATSPTARVRRLAWRSRSSPCGEADERRRSRAARVPRPARARPRVLRDPGTGWDVRPSSARAATRTCCSTSSRTPTRSSASSRRCSRPPIPTEARRPAVGRDRRSTPGGCSSSATPSSRSTGSGGPTSPRSSRARSAFGAAPRHLTRNFRTARPVIEFVNHVFGELIAADPESQPEYVALDPGARDAAGRSRDVLLGGEAHERSRCAPTSCVSARRPTWPRRSCTALADGWAVVTQGPERREAWRAVPAGRHRDPAPGAHVARPARGRARRRRHPVPGRDVVAGLRHPRDPRPADGAAGGRRPHRRARRSSPRCARRCSAAATTTSTRSSVDAPRSLEPPGAAARVAARTTTRSPRRCVRSPRGTTRVCGSAPSELLDRIVRERRVLEVAFAHGRPRDLWRRVRFVIDQARAFSEATGSTPAGGGLRDFLRWADLQSARRRARSSRRCCPRPTTMRCASSPSTARRASSSRSRSCRA